MLDPLPFAKGRHLLVALAAMLVFAASYLWLIESAGVLRLLAVFGGTGEWTLEAVTSSVALLVIVVAVPAWFVQIAWDTRSGVTFWPRSWKGLLDGPLLLLAAVVVLWQLVANLSLTTAERALKAERHHGLMFDDGVLDWGWYMAHTSMGVLAEELLFSVLLQRAFEGYMPEFAAACARAGVFLLVHQYLYGYGLMPFHALTGLLFGLVFMRTRSLMAPVLVHLLVNINSAALTLRGLGT
ncbi:MAG: CPBP family intramembrane metalloprotease [Deltaproteobacteria bacterium]|nr:CPBP family intramembrane metalloprotease [Deltaproteobacteria bacterium]